MKMINDKITKMVDTIVDEELLLEGIVIDKQKFESLRKKIHNLSVSPVKPIKSDVSIGGLHLDDVVIYAYFFEQEGALFEQEWGFEQEYDYHLSVMYDSTSEPVKKALQKIELFNTMSLIKSMISLQILYNWEKIAAENEIKDYIIELYKRSKEEVSGMIRKSNEAFLRAYKKYVNQMPDDMKDFDEL